MALGMMTLAYNNGQEIVQKSRVVNAADAAAYSGSVWAARRMNLIAYTNRAMVANHIAVGHLITYTSWLRYVEDVITKLDKAATFIPAIKPATNAAKQVVENGVYLTEKLAQGYVPAMDTINRLYSTAQVEARIDLTPPRVNKAMEQVAQTHDKAMEVNDSGAITSMPSPFGSATMGLLAKNQLKLVGLVESYTPGDDQGEDDGRMSSLVDDTIAADGDVENWMSGKLGGGFSGYSGFSMGLGGGIDAGAAWGSGQRGWQEEFFPIIRFRKQGPTADDLGGDESWQANDRFQVSEYIPEKTEWGGWQTLAAGSAEADEFYSNYEGIWRYQGMDPEEPERVRQKVVAVVTMPRSQAASHDAFEVEGNSGPGPLGYASAAEIVYDSPSDCNPGPCPNGNKGEYSNLFNPFWRAQLAEAPISSLLPSI